MRGRKAYDPPEDGEIERFLCDIKELSQELGICERRIRTYVKRGLPRRQDGRFYMPTAVRYHERFFADDMTRYWD